MTNNQSKSNRCNHQDDTDVGIYKDFTVTLINISKTIIENMILTLDEFRDAWQKNGDNSNF